MVTRTFHPRKTSFLLICAYSIARVQRRPQCVVSSRWIIACPINTFSYSLGDIKNREANQEQPNHFTGTSLHLVSSTKQILVTISQLIFQLPLHFLTQNISEYFLNKFRKIPKCTCTFASLIHPRNFEIHGARRQGLPMFVRKHHRLNRGGGGKQLLARLNKNSKQQILFRNIFGETNPRCFCLFRILFRPCLFALSRGASPLSRNICRLSPAFSSRTRQSLLGPSYFPFPGILQMNIINDATSSPLISTPQRGIIAILLSISANSRSR